MPLTTFLSDCELNRPTSNSEINELLTEIRKLTTDDWQVLEYVHNERTWMFFKKPVTYKTYVIYKYVGGMGPWQQICLYSGSFSDENLESNLVTNVCEVVAFLYGLLSGLNKSSKDLQRDKHVV